MLTGGSKTKKKKKTSGGVNSNGGALSLGPTSSKSGFQSHSLNLSGRSGRKDTPSEVGGKLKLGGGAFSAWALSQSGGRVGNINGVEAPALALAPPSATGDNSRAGNVEHGGGSAPAKVGNGDAVPAVVAATAGRGGGGGKGTKRRRKVKDVIEKCPKEVRIVFDQAIKLGVRREVVEAAAKRYLDMTSSSS